MVAFEKVLDGIAKYIDREIYAGMNDWQEVLARIAVGRVFENREQLKNRLVNSGVIRTFGVISEDGMVDVDGLASDLKKQIEQKGKITVSLPMFGKLTFKAEDVEKLHRTIMEG